MAVNQFQLFSKYRTPLMGLSILWVMLFHSYPVVDYGSVFYWIANYGYGGVDIFLFLSGLGLYYGSLKKQSLLQFYKKRFVRVLPAYIIVALVYCLYNNVYSLSDYFLLVSTVGFWTNNIYLEWYIPSLLVLYLFFPIYIYIFKKSPTIVTLLAILSAVIVVLSYSIFDKGFYVNLFFYSRIPIFAIGVWFGKLASEGKVDSKCQSTIKILLYALSLLGIFLLVYSRLFYPDYLLKGMHWLPFMFVTPGLCLFISTVLERIPLRDAVLKVLAFLGPISLEIYLIHTILLYPKLEYYSDKLDINIWIVLLVITFLSIISAYILNKLLNSVISFLKI